MTTTRHTNLKDVEEEQSVRKQMLQPAIIAGSAARRWIYPQTLGLFFVTSFATLFIAGCVTHCSVSKFYSAKPCRDAGTFMSIVRYLYNYIMQRPSPVPESALAY